jgi:hypothetical protein
MRLRLWLPLAALLYCGHVGALATAAASLNEVTIVTAQGRHAFTVELAATPDTRRQGLMHRRELAQDAGMLFIFERRGPRSFWMKNTLIALDMLFLVGDGRIVYIHHNAQPHSLTAISPAAAVAVLEINGGLSRRLGIKVGDQVLHPSLMGRR